MDVEEVGEEDGGQLSDGGEGQMSDGDDGHDLIVVLLKKLVHSGTT